MATIVAPVYNSSENEWPVLPDDYEFFTKPLSIASQVFAISVIILTDLVGNVLMCYAVYKTPSLQTLTNIYTVNLGVVDLSVAVLILPMWIVSTVHLSWPLPEVLCHITAFMTVLLLTCSIYTLAGISLDRYFSICHPLRYPGEVTEKRVLLSIAFIWIVSALLAGAPLVGWGRYSFKPQTIPICNPQWLSDISYSIVLVLLGITIPLAVIMFSYICIISVARKQAKRIAAIQVQLQHPTANFNNDDDKQNDLFKRKKSAANFKSFTTVTKNLKTLKMLFIVVGAFFLCWGPYVILNFWSVNNEFEAVPYVADLLTTYLAFTNSSLNPLIFNILSRDFRLATKTIVRRMLCFWRKDMVSRLRNQQVLGSNYNLLKETRGRESRTRRDTPCCLRPEECCAADSIAVSPACTVSTSDGVVLNPNTLSEGSFRDSGQKTPKPMTPSTRDCKEEILPGSVS